MKSDLESVWKDCFSFPGCKLSEATLASELSSLRARYSEPARHYHTIRHIEALLALQEEFCPGDQDVSLAIFFHDAVYDPKGSTNEEQSAVLARELLERSGMDPARIDFISRMILATKSHSVPQTDERIRCFLDLDLSILGAASDEYQRYAEAVRKEYSWIPGPVFSFNRRKFLKKLLASQRIFQTEELRARFEVRARENLERELG